jgi:hypothetical protein
MSLSNLEKTLLLCIEKTNDEDKLARLKEHLRIARTKNLSSDDGQILPKEGVQI